MRAISIWQPWASALVADRTVLGSAIRPKQYETRGWSTNHRGPLVICASKKWDPELQRTAVLLSNPLAAWRCPHSRAAVANRQWPLVGLFDGESTSEWILPLGCALGVVDLVDCIPSERMQGQVPEWEWALGDYSAGRFAWRTDNLRRFDRPVSICGRQGLFDIPDHYIERALAP